jgi:hypothetical protein
MSKIKIAELISSLAELGAHLQNPDEELIQLIQTEHRYNPWFTPENVEHALKATGKSLNKPDLTTWLDRYNLSKDTSPQKIGLILAGNIPLVGFHDVLCVLVTGNKALIKASSQDARLIKAVLNKLVAIDSNFFGRFSFVDRLAGFDAVIATGSNNTSRYFDYYFGKVPHIIRKNRNSIAVLTGNETAEELHQLGHDIFDYFGLGCRNVSKLFIPRGYDIATFFEAIESYKDIVNHNKYNNNYGYNKSIYLVGQEQHLDNGFLLLKENDALASPLAVVFYNYYDNLADVEQFISAKNENIQCIVSKAPLQIKNQLVGFGKSQQPKLWDYADGVDTMEFLIELEQKG